jgi:hypothetical protein
MFEYDQRTDRMVDQSNGDELRTLDAHWQSDSTKVGVFSSHGTLKFSATWRSYSIDEPHTWPTDKVSRRILLSAAEYDPEGRGTPVKGPHPQIDRLVDFYRRSAMSKSNFVAFEFVDERNKAAP